MDFLSILRIFDYFRPPQKKDCIPRPYDLHGPVWVVDVYDGDTFTVAARTSHFWSPWYMYSVRVRGIDTPEIRTKNAAEKAAAIRAREHSTELLLNKRVVVSNIGKDKYGRLLCDIHTMSGENYAERMVSLGFAKAYDGGTKEAFTTPSL